MAIKPTVTTVAILAILAVTGCTSIKVSPVPSTADLKKVCIVENPKVEVADFVDVLRDGFSQHHIATSVVSEDEAKSCGVTLTYTALRSWDFKPYLSHAELRLWKNGIQIGSAIYHLNGKGGLDFAKWEGTAAKMDPVIDKLLQNYSTGN